MGAADRLSIRLHDDIVIIKLEELLFLKAEKGKTMLYTKEGRYASPSGIGTWEGRLKEAGFIRCHRGYIVNTAYIRKLIHILGDYRELELSYCDVNIPVSRQKVGAVEEVDGNCVAYKSPAQLRG